jgi:hypothetical protein
MTDICPQCRAPKPSEIVLHLHLYHVPPQLGATRSSLSSRSTLSRHPLCFEKEDDLGHTLVLSDDVEKAKLQFVGDASTLRPFGKALSNLICSTTELDHFFDGHRPGHDHNITVPIPLALPPTTTTVSIATDKAADGAVPSDRHRVRDGAAILIC